MLYSLITPCLPTELPQLHALKENLNRQITHNFEWLIACNQPLDLTSSTWQAPFPIRQIQFQPTTIGAARNAAIAAATGDWLVFIDSDDYLLPAALSEVAAIIPVRSQATLYDLNQYPTYEPHDAFLTSHQTSDAQDDMPKWGGLKRQRPKRHVVSMATNAIIPQAQQLDPVVLNWLQHRYYEHTGNQRWTGINRQLKVTGKIVARQLVNDHDLKFDEKNTLYPDGAFMANVLRLTTSTLRLSKPSYVRVKHNDPINAPSVHQLDDPQRWTKRVLDWQAALAQLEPGSAGFNAISIRSLHRLHCYLYAALATHTRTVATEQVNELMATLQNLL
ncbi:glycosyltransferase family A protein [Lactiplantibacillus plajomi]|uniref:Glycosyltransferase family A protein n=1 Tax=Lactiplantibacillus plajomi TaxID=1457217 RepID=A0ABV6K3G5_9LACO|nr:glycosyltransferase family A protein [Lactiplantibacillus plajomi]